MSAVDEIPNLVQNLYAIVSELERLFPSRRFTPDGHLVGSIGEVLAAYHYDLQLLPASRKRHDAEARDGRKVQIKATQANSIAMRSQPDYLIAIRILRDGSFEEVYNGPGDVVWKSAGKMQSNGQRPISLGRLFDLMKDVASGSGFDRRAS